MADRPTSRGIKKDFNFDTLHVDERLTLPSIDISNSTATRPILPAGNLGLTTQTLPSVAPVKNLVYSDGKSWVPLASTSALAPEVGYIGLGFTSSQLIPISTPTIVRLDTNYGTAFPLPSSFTTDLDPPNYGFIILTAGIYQINYQLSMTATSLTAGGDQVTYTSNISYPTTASGTQYTANDLVYGPFTIGGSSGVVLQGMAIVSLDATNSNVVLNVNHNSANVESVNGPTTGPFVGAPDDYQSYMQITRIG